jgi:OmpA-OmpF porin, OOP family
MRKPFAAILVALATLVPLGGCQTLAPEEKKQEAQVPKPIDLPAVTPDSQALPESVWKNIPKSPEDIPIKILSTTWQATSGINAAIGGATSAPDSLVARAGLTKISLEIQDDSNLCNAALVADAQSPGSGASFIWSTGDSWAQAAGQVNKELAKYGDKAVVIMSGGFSDGEDCLMGPPEWLKDPQQVKGKVIVGQIRGCNFNVVLKWAADNKIAVNPDATTYDPDAINFEDAANHIEAAQKFVTNQKVSRKNKKSGQTEQHTLAGCATWTPGDVTAFTGRPGTVKIVSTRDYRSMMPHLFIGRQKWVNEHRQAVETLMRCVFAANDQIKSNPEYFKYAMKTNAKIFNQPDKDEAYWTKYFPGVKENANGVEVLLGGSRVNNLGDNLQLFGLEGGKNLFAETYTAFGQRTVDLYPTVLSSFPPAADIVDLSFLKNVSTGMKPA